MTATLSGFAPGTRDVVVGGANVEVPAISLALASLSDTIVVSATKSETALIDAPATHQRRHQRNAGEHAGAELRRPAALASRA